MAGLKKKQIETAIKVSLALAVLLQICFWYTYRHTKARWLNVPPSPTYNAALGQGLGDPELAYRMMGIFLQNIGNSGGRYVPLKDYDLNALAGWLYLSDKLDGRSNFMPYLAAYYFGGTQNTKTLYPVVHYLASVGKSDPQTKWRWMASAVFMARYKIEDYDLALSLARDLASDYRPGMPGWVKQMPAFILNADGKKEMSRRLILQLIHDDAKDMHPSEIFNMTIYLCSRVLDKDEAAKEPVCQNIAGKY